MLAAPALSLVKSNTADVATASITQGTATYTLDLKLDTDGLTISGLQLYLVTDPAAALSYAATPVTALDTPFITSDIAAAPDPGAGVQQTGGTIALFKSSTGDYSAIDDQSILRLAFNTASLAPGQYTFTPVPEELSNADTVLTSGDFAPSGDFLLTVTPVPEPAAITLLSLGGLALLPRRR